MGSQTRVALRVSPCRRRRKVAGARSCSTIPPGSIELSIASTSAVDGTRPLLPAPSAVSSMGCCSPVSRKGRKPLSIASRRAASRASRADSTAEAAEPRHAQSRNKRSGRPASSSAPRSEGVDAATHRHRRAWKARVRRARPVRVSKGTCSSRTRRAGAPGVVSSCIRPASSQSSAARLERAPSRTASAP